MAQTALIANSPMEQLALVLGLALIRLVALVLGVVEDDAGCDYHNCFGQLDFGGFSVLNNYRDFDLSYGEEYCENGFEVA